MTAASDYMRVLAQLEEAKGQALGQARLQQGQIWGQTIAGLGSTLPQQIITAIKTGQIRDAIKQAGGDISQALPRINQIDPILGSELLAKYTTAQKSTAEIREINARVATAQQAMQTAQSEAEQKKLGWLLNQLDSVKDDESLDQVKLTAASGAKDFPQLAQIAQALQGKNYAQFNGSGIQALWHNMLIEAKERGLKFEKFASGETGAAIPNPNVMTPTQPGNQNAPPPGTQAPPPDTTAPPPTTTPPPAMAPPPVSGPPGAGAGGAAPPPTAPPPGPVASAGAPGPSTPTPTGPTLTGAPTAQTGYDWLLSTPGLTQQERSSIRGAAERNNTKAIMPSVWMKAFPGVKGPGQAEQMWQASVDALVSGQGAAPAAAAPLTPAAAPQAAGPPIVPPAALSTPAPTTPPSSATVPTGVVLPVDPRKGGILFKAPVRPTDDITAAFAATDDRLPENVRWGMALDRVMKNKDLSAQADKQYDDLMQQKLDAAKGVPGVAPLTQHEENYLAAYADRKRIGPLATSEAAQDRQTAAIKAETDRQKAADLFRKQEVGRAYLKEVEAKVSQVTDTSNLLRKTVAAAQAGNKIASQFEPIASAMGAMKSLGYNTFSPEVTRDVEGAGGIFDRLVGSIGALKGDRMDESLKNDMLKYADLLDKQAQESYKRDFNTAKQRYELTDEKMKSQFSGVTGPNPYK